MSKKRGLGKGLGALIPGGDDSELPAGRDSGLQMAPVGAISPNPRQPRSHLDQAALAELADSIREHGVIQPLLVNRAAGGRYTLIAGERRWRAAQQAGLAEVPVLIKEATPQAMLELALIENIQRADLNPLEEALAYRQLLDEFGLTQEEVARQVGKGRSTIANQVRLLDLPPNIQQALTDGEISGAHARSLLPLPTPEAQTAVMNSIIKQGLSVRQVEAIVKKMVEGEKPRPRPAHKPAVEVAALEAQFRQSLGTRVNVHKGPQGGRVIIYFYSDEELQAIYDAIVGEATNRSDHA
ncbi:MAG: ParB/RepB/Spo0J family partition protein [Chloroflexi bacterium]|nr:ParB/RepB/Spo0J family partition protein [Chloroflexota bacterium]MCI0644507.1 ParB/RepB/Spo0J family partition protein [Chloroflexota bacterium]MCI0728804.1 ParB/RepB/Spo0J family partition protein [Chloroflexota bacterium]